ncbi:type IV toxin-antitoxin system AbiEi family antitoxin domain-containing protein, partial [uncultured Phenylobacterium sp.]|uniref:type IV toxin-antitoxin system AbiEi family antitoxin domain-containing protein n=1 Tax=uncultured Phenylobacterium sp. TaxID=349273 RepID=UPI0025F3CBFB
MAMQMEGKLNQLLRQLPEGLVVDAGWMERHCYSRSLRSQYVSAGWLEQPANRVYRRPRGALSWEFVVISLQNLLELPLVVGGRTALQVQGASHYLAQEMREVHLYGPRPPPTWLAKLPLDVAFHHHNSARLFAGEPTARGLTSLAFDPDRQAGWSTDSIHGLRQITWGSWNWPITVSTPERALLELLDELPDRESFHQADKLVEGLSGLSPRRLTKLLTDCRSVKVKRLFFFFADRHQHAWRRQFKAEAFDLGSGNRVLVKG